MKGRILHYFFRVSVASKLYAYSKGLDVNTDFSTYTLFFKIKKQKQEKKYMGMDNLPIF